MGLLRSWAVASTLERGADSSGASLPLASRVRDDEGMRRRQYRPRRSSPGDELLALEREMKTWLRRHQVRGDNPPGPFRRWQAFLGEWHEWSPREEADYVRWALMEDGTSYEDADAELREGVSVDAHALGRFVIVGTLTDLGVLPRIE